MSDRPNLQMQDFAETDKRSVGAMLRSKGDGREKSFLSFEAQTKLVDPLLDDEEIGAFYRRHCAEYHEKRCETQVFVTRNSLGPAINTKRFVSRRIIWHLAMSALVAAALTTARGLFRWP